MAFCNFVPLASAFGLNDLPAHLKTPFQNPIARNPLLVIKRLAALSVSVIDHNFVIHNISLVSFYFVFGINASFFSEQYKNPLDKPYPYKYRLASVRD